MLRHLFTSKTRVKLLTQFLLKPDGEYFVRELTRELDEQINSVRRELDNLKKMGLLRSRAKNRHKFYAVNKDFVLFHELRSILLKGQPELDSLIKTISKKGKIDYLLISGTFLQKESPVDLLIVGDLDKEELAKYLDSLEKNSAIRFTVLSQKDFLYRIQCEDKFILDLINDKNNRVGINKILNNEEAHSEEESA